MNLVGRAGARTPCELRFARALNVCSVAEDIVTAALRHDKAEALLAIPGLHLANHLRSAAADAVLASYRGGGQLGYRAQIGEIGGRAALLLHFAVGLEEAPGEPRVHLGRTERPLLRARVVEVHPLLLAARGIGGRRGARILRRRGVGRRRGGVGGGSVAHDGSR